MPRGVVSLDERLQDLWERYKERMTLSKEQFEIQGEYARKLEQILFQKSGITPDSITNERVAEKIPELMIKYIS